MKAIIADKLYDTEKATEVYTYRRKRIEGSVFLLKGTGFVCWDSVTIYKTTKGAYFEVARAEQSISTPDRLSITALDDVKSVVKHLNPDKYIELFGEIEEA